MKKVLITIGIIILCFTCYITIDCIKLRNSKIGTKPLITLDYNITKNGYRFTGLGYTIDYYIDETITQEYDVTLVGINGYGAEFRLFGKILICAWVE